MADKYVYIVFTGVLEKKLFSENLRVVTETVKAIFTSRRRAMDYLKQYRDTYFSDVDDMYLSQEATSKKGLVYGPLDEDNHRLFCSYQRFTLR